LDRPVSGHYPGMAPLMSRKRQLWLALGMGTAALLIGPLASLLAWHLLDFPHGEWAVATTSILCLVLYGSWVRALLFAYRQRVRADAAEAPS
jgi:hypothetical protein